jgi:hypothetical protein
MLSKEEIEKMAAANGDEVYHLANAKQGWEIVFKRPTRPACKQWRAQVTDPARKSESTEILLKTCVVFPNVRDGAFDALLDRFPLIPENAKLAEIIGRITGMTGGDEGAEEKESGPSATTSEGT